MVEIRLTGNLPAKKNQLKLTKSGHGYYAPELRATLNDISDQVSRQWSRKNLDGHRVMLAPLLHPAIAIVFYVVSERSDKDGKYTTVLDALVSGGVLKDDCIALCNGPMLICEAVKTPSSAGARIFLEESGDFDRLWAYVKREDLRNYSWLKDLKVARSAKASGRRSLRRA